MGIMTYLRHKAGLLIGAIGFAIVAFLVSDAIRSGSPFWNASKNKVGEVAGESMSYEEFNQKLEEAVEDYRARMGGSLTPAMTTYLAENTWSDFVTQVILNKEYEKLGLAVGGNELFDMIQGKNPDPQIVQYFSDPETGQFDRAKLLQFLKNIDKDPSGKGKAQWMKLEDKLVERQLIQKYASLVTSGLYATSLEANDEYMANQKQANFKYVSLDYASVPDSKVILTEDDYEEYYEKHKNKFKNKEEFRTVKYVVFDAAPTAKDTLDLRNQMLKLLAEFKTTKNDSLFVALNAETKRPVTYLQKGKQDPIIDSVMFKANKGFILGPIVSRGAFKIAKLIDTKISPDSVSASHILFDPAALGGIDKAKKQADSVKNLLLTGASFAELAKRFSADPGSKNKGGKLGVFGRGNMVSEFENACFDGKVGEYKIVNTQYGVHLIKIEQQIGSSRVAKIAVVDKAIVPSAETQQTMYGKANEFLGLVGDGSDFEAKAKSAKLTAQTANEVLASQAYVAGISEGRELVKWAYKSEENDITKEVLELGDKYVVAKLVSISEKGFKPLASIKKQIEYEVKQAKKGELLKQTMESSLANTSSIEQLSSKIGQSAIPVPNATIAMFKSTLDPSLIGAVFGSKVGRLSKPIVGDRAVYCFVVDNFIPPAVPIASDVVKQDLSQKRANIAANKAVEALKDKIEIENNLIKFY